MKSCYTPSDNLQPCKIPLEIGYSKKKEYNKSKGITKIGRKDTEAGMKVK
jgi:hypothetical protein